MKIIKWIFQGQRRENRKSRNRKRAHPRQRKRAAQKLEKNNLATVNDGENFVQLWAPQSEITEIKSNKGSSYYYEGGRFYESGRRLWKRPCSKAVNFYVIGDSQVYKVISIKPINHNCSFVFLPKVMSKLTIIQSVPWGEWTLPNASW